MQPIVLMGIRRHTIYIIYKYIGLPHIHFSGILKYKNSDLQVISISNPGICGLLPSYIQLYGNSGVCVRLPSISTLCNSISVEVKLPVRILAPT